MCVSRLLNMWCIHSCATMLPTKDRLVHLDAILHVLKQLNIHPGFVT